MAAGEPVTRGRLASLLWDRVSENQARTSFRQALRELSTAMGPVADELITGDRDTVRLEPDLCWIDALAIVSSDPPPPQSSRGDLVCLCSGDLLEGLDGVSVAFDHWLLAERTRFAERLRALLEGELNQLDRLSVDAEKCAAMARSVIAFEPTHEGASRILMRALVDMGERAQALREYERCREALKTTLDVEPSGETRSLYQALRTFTTHQTRNERQPSEIVSSPEIPKLRVLASSPAPSSRLRVGVLPFQGKHSPRNESLAYCLSQEIAAALARFRWFDVIAPESLPRASSPGVRTSFLRRKQLHYIVDGDLSGNEERFQISVRLLDITQDTRPVWNDRFELTVDALDQINEFVTSPVVARIDPVIFFIEGQQTRPHRSGATGLVLRAVSLMYGLERESYEEAGRLLNRAMDADPDNAKAAAWAGYWQVWYVGQGWSENPSRAVARARELALRAIRIDPDNAEALGLYAHICAFLEKDFDSAVYYFERALRLNPNVAFIWALSAPTYCYIGEPDLALQRLKRYRELAPFDPHFGFWESMYTIVYTFRGDYEHAVSVGRRTVKANPQFSNGYKPLIASLGHLGRPEEASAYVEKLLILEPSFTIEKFGKSYPFKRSEDRERYMQGLRLAGVPEA
jgi:DNA-binding SARP family transcriptional activator/TolB-like protein